MEIYKSRNGWRWRMKDIKGEELKKMQEIAMDVIMNEKEIKHDAKLWKKYTKEKKEWNLKDERKKFVDIILKSNIEPMVAELIINMIQEQDDEFIRREKKGCGKFICWIVVRGGNYNTGDTGEQKPLRCGDGVTCHECLDKLVGSKLK